MLCPNWGFPGVVFPKLAFFRDMHYALQTGPSRGLAPEKQVHNLVTRFRSHHRGMMKAHV